LTFLVELKRLQEVATLLECLFGTAFFEVVEMSWPIEFLFEATPDVKESCFYFDHSDTDYSELQKMVSFEHEQSLIFVEKSTDPHSIFAAVHRKEYFVAAPVRAAMVVVVKLVAVAAGSSRCYSSTYEGLLEQPSLKDVCP
jgi:hypothetical protein